MKDLARSARIPWTVAVVLVVLHPATAGARERQAPPSGADGGAEAGRDPSRPTIDAASPLAGPSAGELTARIERLILQLGSSRYLERSEAERELLAIGYDAFDYLKAAETSQDPEIAARSRHLTRQLTVNWTRESDSPAARQLLLGFERMSTEERYHLVGRLAALRNDEGLEPLCRIVRFAESDLVAKRAALAVIAAADVPAARAETIERSIGTSRRVAAAWLRTFLHELQDPAGSIKEWQQHMDTELVELAGANNLLQRYIAIDLLQHVSELHEELGNDEELLATLMQMVELDENGSADVMERLVERLIRTENWTAVEQIVKKFENRFRENPILMYMLAEARREHEDLEKSQELADAAFKLSENSILRRAVADELVTRGLFEWAEREYREVLLTEPAISDQGILAVTWLSALLYDIQRHKEAADLLDNYLDQWEEEVAKDGEAVLGRITLLNGQELEEQIDQFKARADYNRACHAKMQNDPVTERKYLEEAIQHSPRDIDVLIAMYHLPEDDVDFRSDVLRRIAEEADRMEADLRRIPNNATLYNNWAWLIANTHGDYEKAVRYAHRAVEMAREDSLAGFLDTLGRAYYAKGDLTNALKYQRRAAELDPHTQQLQRQLAEFEAAANP